MVRVTDSELVVGRNLRIPLEEIELRASRSSGPGGQHANKTSTRIEAVWNAAESAAPGEGQRARIVAKLGPVVRSASQSERSQLRNRQLALHRLGERIEDSLKVRRQRVATKPTKAAREKRLEVKRTRSSVKAARRKPTPDD